MADAPSLLLDAPFGSLRNLLFANRLAAVLHSASEYAHPVRKAAKRICCLLPPG